MKLKKLIKKSFFAVMALITAGASSNTIISEKNYIPGLDFLNIDIKITSKETSPSTECDGGPDSGMGTNS